MNLIMQDFVLVSMKWICVSFLCLISLNLLAQDQNTNKKGVLIDGYDVVSYFCICDNDYFSHQRGYRDDWFFAVFP